MRNILIIVKQNISKPFDSKRISHVRHLNNPINLNINTRILGINHSFLSQNTEPIKNKEKSKCSTFHS